MVEAQISRPQLVQTIDPWSSVTVGQGSESVKERSWTDTRHRATPVALADMQEQRRKRQATGS